MGLAIQHGTGKLADRRTSLLAEVRGVKLVNEDGSNTIWYIGGVRDEEVSVRCTESRQKHTQALDLFQKHMTPDSGHQACPSH